MTKKLAIVGVGDWGSKIVRTVSSSEDLDLVAAVTSKSVAAMRQIAPFGGTVHEDYRELHEHSGRLDGVIVATPPSGRERIVDYFLDLDVPVFAEKPMTQDARETRKLIQKSQRSGTPLVEDFIHLYSWPYIAIRQELSSASRIEIESAGGNCGPIRDYSPVLDYGPHDLSMTLQIFGCRPSVTAVDVLDRRSDYEFSTRVELDFADRGGASLEFGNTFTEKRRYFRCRANGDEWVYDDIATHKLSRNGRVYTRSMDFQDFSPLELALRCFTGNYALYSRDECLWLSESVAELTAEIKDSCA